MIHSIPNRPRKPKQLLSIQWIQDGFNRGCWTIQEYVAIALMLGWMLRTAEVCNTQWNGHLLTWNDITFLCSSPTSEWLPLPMADLRTVPCDIVHLQPQSRKFQEQTGTHIMPGRVNTCYLVNPSQGLTQWTDLCMATIIQAWAIHNNIDTMSPTERAQRPLLAAPGSNKSISAKDLRHAMKRLAALRHEDPETVMPHCLRLTGINILANSDVMTNAHSYLMAVGHKSLDASKSYNRSTPAMAAKITHTMQSHH